MAARPVRRPETARPFLAPPAAYDSEAELSEPSEAGVAAAAWV